MRRKLIEQVIESACMIDTMSAAATTAHVSSSIDREGFLSAYFVCQTKTSTGNDTASPITFYVYDSSDNSTFAVHESAVSTVTMNYSTSVTADGFNIDLAGAKRYIKAYATVTGATTISATITVACILGDAVEEPAAL